MVGGTWVTEWLELLAAIPNRVGEVVADEQGDVVMDQVGVVTVRHGKGDRYRQVSLNAEVRVALDALLAKRATLPQTDGPALFCP